MRLFADLLTEMYPTVNLPLQVSLNTPIRTNAHRFGGNNGIGWPSEWLMSYFSNGFTGLKTCNPTGGSSLLFSPSTVFEMAGSQES